MLEKAADILRELSPQLSEQSPHAPGDSSPVRPNSRRHLLADTSGGETSSP